MRKRETRDAKRKLFFEMWSFLRAFCHVRMAESSNQAREQDRRTLTGKRPVQFEELCVCRQSPPTNHDCQDEWPPRRLKNDGGAVCSAFGRILSEFYAALA
jgi:hypothetical protein